MINSKDIDEPRIIEIMDRYSLSRDIFMTPKVFKLSYFIGKKQDTITIEF